MTARGGLTSKMVAMACVFMMIIVPVTAMAQTFTGTLYGEKVNNKANTIGEAKIELYHYASIDSDGQAKVVQSGNLLETERWLSLPGKTTDAPVNATEPMVRYNTNDSVAGLRPDGTVTNVVSQVRNGEMSWSKTWTGTSDPQGQGVDTTFAAFDQSYNLVLGGNINDSLVTAVQPAGTPPSIQTKSNDSTPSLVEPTGTVGISSLTDDSALTLVQPTGAPGINTYIGNASASTSQPNGVQDNVIRPFGGVATIIAPAGAHAITPQTVNLTANVVAPVGVPPSLSGTYYEGNFSVDGNESGEADSLVNIVLIDVLVAGTYDTMALSINDVIFNEGVLVNGIVDHGSGVPGNTDDELIPATTDLILGNAPLFTVAFDGNPTLDDDDARITTKEWYTGSLLVDADEDGAADDTVYYSIYDETSDGVFDSVDLSLGDNNFGEGDLGNATLVVGDDETLNNTGGGGGGKFGPDDGGYTWTDEADYNWIEINQTGSDPDLGLDDYNDTIDLGFDFEYYGHTYNSTTLSSHAWITFNETDAGDLTWWPSNVPSQDGYEGPICFFCRDIDPDEGGTITVQTLGSAPNRYFVVEFDEIEEWGAGNPNTAELILYETTNIIKMQFKVVASSLDAIGIERGNETTGIGDAAQGDLLINLTNVTNGTAFEFYPSGIGGGGSNYVTIGKYGFTIEVDATPSLSANDINITSSMWFTESIHFDTDDGGVPNDLLFYTIGDTDSDGIYETLDLSLNGTYGVGLLGNNIVNETNGERVPFGGLPVTVTIGPSMPFSIDFDQFPEADASDLRLTALRWYDGSFTVDADGDGVVDDIIYYVLTDVNSDGAYESIDLSYGDTTYGEGTLTDNNVNQAGDDERYQAGANVFLGPDILFTVTTSGSPEAGAQDLTIKNEYTFKGNFSFDSDSDGAADDDLYFVITDKDSDGIYDTLDLSFDPVFGDGTLNDGVMTQNPFDDERLSADGSVDLGEDMTFDISFDPDPQADNDDIRMSIKVWFKGTFVLDANDDGDAGENVHYILSDTDSDGFFDTMDLSLGDETFGEGALSDGTLSTGNDERITEGTILTIGSTLKYSTTFSGSPGGMDEDAILRNSDLYTGTFTVDLGFDGVADDVVNFVISDFDSNGLYDTVDLSLENEIYRQDLSTDGYVDSDNNDERMDADGEVRIGAFLYDLTFVPNPHTASADAFLTSKQWYLGEFDLDADGDGLKNETLHFLISDLDSNGVYDTMDLSLGDITFGEGTTTDTALSTGDDETITATTEVAIGDILYELRFTPSPNQNIEDGWMKNIRWFTGTLGSDAWTVHYAICDKDSDGLYDTVELSNDDTFGQGDAYDDYLKLNNDEVLADRDMVVKDKTHFLTFVNTSMAGPKDMGLQSLEWRTGRWLVEGVKRSVAVSDADSDMVMDTIHLDMNDDGSYNSAEDITGGIEGFKGSLVMRYAVASSNDDGTEVEIAPMGGSTDDTDSWMVGAVLVEATTVALAVSDANGDGTFDTVDIDPDRDGELDHSGMKEHNDVFGSVGDGQVQVIRVSPKGEWARLVPYTDTIIGSAVDNSLTGVLRYGSVDESVVGNDMNGDGDKDDTFHGVIVDVRATGPTSAKNSIFLDIDLDDDMIEEEPMMVGTVFEMGASDWKLEEVASNRGHIGVMKVKDPAATYRTGPDGTFTLTPAGTGTYWIRISSERDGWGYQLFEDTKDHEGYTVTAAGISDKDLTLLQSGTYISGIVTDMITGDTIPGVRIDFQNSKDEVVVSTLTLSDGSYLLSLQRNKVFDVTFSKNGYVTDDGTISGGTYHGLAVGGGRDDVDVSLMPDPAPDIMSFVEPASGAVLTGSVTVTVAVTDIVNVDKLMLTVNNGLSWTEMNDLGGNSFSSSWDTTMAPDGTYTVTARATNEAGLRADAHLEVVVDNGGPVVVFKTGDEQYGAVNIVVRVEDEFSDVEKVEVSVDNGPWTSMTRSGKDYTYTWSSGPFDSGTHNYKVRATDSRGNTETYQSKVTVDNTWMLLLIVTIIVGILVAVVALKKRGGKKPEETPGIEPAPVQQPGSVPPPQETTEGPPLMEAPPPAQEPAPEPQPEELITSPAPLEPTPEPVPEPPAPAPDMTPPPPQEGGQ